MTVYMQGTYMVRTTSVHAYTGFQVNQLSQQVFRANTEMQYRVIYLNPLLQGRMRMGTVPVQKMVNCFHQFFPIFFTSQSFLHCSRKQSIFLAFYKEITKLLSWNESTGLSTHTVQTCTYMFKHVHTCMLYTFTILHTCRHMYILGVYTVYTMCIDFCI